MNIDDPQERSANAGEYVLGTLSAAERIAFEAALHNDAALQAEVYAWQDRLLGMTRRIAPAEAAPGAWAAIEARLGAAAVSASAGGANAPLPGSKPAANDPFWQRLRRWQLTSAVALAASVVLASLLVLRGPVEPVAPQRYLALLQSPTDQRTNWIVEATAGGEIRLIQLGPASAPPSGKTLQFWTKAEGASAPTSLGVVVAGPGAGTVTRLPVASLPALGARQLFELTLEPETGSPTGRPTGPVVCVGRTLTL